MNGRGRFLVRHVMSTESPRRRQPTAVGVVSADVMPLGEVLAMRAALSDQHGPPVVGGVRVGESSYRYAWERFTDEGARLSDVLWIKVLSWS